MWFGGGGALPAGASLALGNPCAQTACGNERLWQVRGKSFRRPLEMFLCSRGAGAAAVVTALGVPWAGGGRCVQKSAGLQAGPQKKYMVQTCHQC